MMHTADDARVICTTPLWRAGISGAPFFLPWCINLTAGPVGVIAVRALARKGIDKPGPGLRKLVRVRLQQVFWKWDARGLTVKVGTGNATRRGLAS